MAHDEIDNLRRHDEMKLTPEPPPASLQQVKDSIYHNFGDETISVSLLLDTLLCLGGPAVDATRVPQIGQDVSHGGSNPSQRGFCLPVGNLSQEGFPQKDGLVHNRKEEGAVVDSSEYTGRRYPKPKSPNRLPGTFNERGRTRTREEEQKPRGRVSFSLPRATSAPLPHPTFQAAQDPPPASSIATDANQVTASQDIPRGGSSTSTPCQSVPVTPTRGDPSSPMTPWLDSTPEKPSSSGEETPGLRPLLQEDHCTPALNGSFDGGQLWKEHIHPEWVRVKTIVDSGASMSVAPPSMAPGVRIEESAMSSRGESFIGAGAQRIANQGQQTLQITTTEGGKERRDTRLVK